MLAVSAKFLLQLREPHVVVVEADVVPAAGGAAIPIALEGGSVRGDRMAQIRRTCSLELAATTARALADLPFGAYLKVRRGVRFGDGSRELVQLGLFRIDGVGSSSPAGTATIEGVDRMGQIRDEPLLAPFAAGGAIASTRIVQLVQAVFPALPTHVSTVGEPALADVTYNGDRAAAVAELAASVGGAAYFDAAGELVVAPTPDAATAPTVWTIDAGTTGVLVSYTDALERAGAVNGVLVRGQASADVAPVEVLVVDDDPSSRTLYGGPFGRVVAVIESTAVQTLAQATAIAQAELAKRLGLTRTLSLTAAPNPALEPGDVVQVVLEDGTTEQHVVDALTIPLDSAGAVTLQTRETLAAGAFALIAGDAELAAALAPAQLVDAELEQVAA